eukprot:3506765-Prymnesium_polylepis.1
MSLAPAPAERSPAAGRIARPADLTSPGGVIPPVHHCSFGRFVSQFARPVNPTQCTDCRRVSLPSATFAARYHPSKHIIRERSCRTIAHTNHHRAAAR